MPSYFAAGHKTPKKTNMSLFLNCSGSMRPCQWKVPVQVLPFYMVNHEKSTK